MCVVEVNCTVYVPADRRMLAEATQPSGRRLQTAILSATTVITVQLDDLGNIIHAIAARKESLTDAVADEGMGLFAEATMISAPSLAVVVTMEFDDGAEVEDFDLRDISNAVSAVVDGVSVEVIVNLKEEITCCPVDYDCGDFKVVGNCHALQLCVPGPHVADADETSGRKKLVIRGQGPQCSNPICDDTCTNAQNGVCNDGRGTGASTCALGTDCTDCVENGFGAAYEYIVSDAQSQFLIPFKATCAAAMVTAAMLSEGLACA